MFKPFLLAFVCLAGSLPLAASMADAREHGERFERIERSERPREQYTPQRNDREQEMRVQEDRSRQAQQDAARRREDAVRDREDNARRRQQEESSRREQQSAPRRQDDSQRESEARRQQQQEFQRQENAARNRQESERRQSENESRRREAERRQIDDTRTQRSSDRREITPRPQKELDRRIDEPSRVQRDSDRRGDEQSRMQRETDRRGNDPARAQREVDRRGDDPSRMQRETDRRGNDPSRAQRETDKRGNDPSSKQRELEKQRFEESTRNRQESDQRQSVDARNRQELERRRSEDLARTKKEFERRQIEDANRTQVERENRLRQQLEISRETFRKNDLLLRETQRMQNEMRAKAAFDSSRAPNKETQFNNDRKYDPIKPRPFVLPPALRVHELPLQKTSALPFINGKISQEERIRADEIIRTLQRSLIAVPIARLPLSTRQFYNRSLSSYRNNYNTYINNRAIAINRDNTYINEVPPYQYPSWYEPEPGWRFSNGFTVGESLSSGLEWLAFGWFQMFGQTPDGFLCTNDYVPTVWIYNPMYGLWRQTGVPGWAMPGPSANYSGPISVEIMEPRKGLITDPETGVQHQGTVNALVLHNAFFDPQSQHWGYLDGHGNFMFVNFY